MSKDSDIQSTPDAFWQEQDQIYHFIHDVAANEENHKTPSWFGPGGEAEDALSVDWPVGGWLWMNPPYSRGIQRQFVEKAIYEAGKRGCQTVGLLPADTSTKLFHELIKPRGPVFLQRRLKFGGADSCAKFGSLLVEITF